MNQPVQHLNKVPEVAEKLSISEKTTRERSKPSIGRSWKI